RATTRIYGSSRFAVPVMMPVVSVMSVEPMVVTAESVEGRLIDEERVGIAVIPIRGVATTPARVVGVLGVGGAGRVVGVDMIFRISAAVSVRITVLVAAGLTLRI